MSDQARAGGAPQMRPGQPGTGRPGSATGRVPRVPGAPNAPRQPVAGAKIPAGAGKPPVRPGGPAGQGVRKPGPATATQTGARPVPGQVGPRPVSGQGGPRPGSAPKGVALATGKKPVASGKLSKAGKRAQLRITRLDLLAMMKMSFLFAFCVSVVMFTSLFVLWNVLVASGAIDSVQSMLTSIMGDADGTASIGLSGFLSSSRVIGFITAVSVINVFILTFLGTLFGALYNTAAVLFGGLEVTLEV